MIDNVVIGWINGKAIVLVNDTYLMFYDGLPEEYALIGEAFTAENADLNLLRPVEELNDEDEKSYAFEMRSEYEKGGE